MGFSPDVRELLCGFSARGIDYMVVGAHALGAHGYPRATGDIDIWVRARPETAGAILAALTDWAGTFEGLVEADFAGPGAVVQLGVAPWRIDILTTISGVTFEEAWPERLVLEIDGMVVAFLGRRHIEINKAAAGRPRDLEDLRRLRGEGDD